MALILAVAEVGCRGLMQKGADRSGGAPPTRSVQCASSLVLFPVPRPSRLCLLHIPRCSPVSSPDAPRSKHFPDSPGSDCRTIPNITSALHAMCQSRTLILPPRSDHSLSHYALHLASRQLGLSRRPAFHAHPAQLNPLYGVPTSLIGVSHWLQKERDS